MSAKEERVAEVVKILGKYGKQLEYKLGKGTLSEISEEKLNSIDWESVSKILTKEEDRIARRENDALFYHFIDNCVPQLLKNFKPADFETALTLGAKSINATHLLLDPYNLYMTALPSTLARVKDLDTLKLVFDYLETFKKQKLSPESIFWRQLPAVLEVLDSKEKLKLVLEFAGDYNEKGVSPQGLSLEALVDSVESKDFKTIKLVLDHLRSYWDLDVDTNYFIGERLPKLIEHYKDEELDGVLSTVLDSVKKYKREVGDPSYYLGHLLPGLVLLSKDMGELKPLLDQTVAHLKAYKQKFDGKGMDNYVLRVLPQIFYYVKDLKNLGFILDNLNSYLNELGDPRDYANYVLKEVTAEFRGEKLKGALDRVLEHLKVSKAVFGKLDVFSLKPGLISTIHKAKDLKTLDLLLTNLEDYIKVAKKSTSYRGHAERQLRVLKNLKTEDLALGLKMLVDYAKEYKQAGSDPNPPINDYALEGIKDLRTLDLMLSSIGDYMKDFGSPKEYAEELLPRVFMKFKGADLEFVLKAILENAKSYKQAFEKAEKDADMNTFAYELRDLVREAADKESLGLVLEDRAHWLETGNLGFRDSAKYLLTKFKDPEKLKLVLEHVKYMYAHTSLRPNVYGEVRDFSHIKDKDVLNLILKHLERNAGQPSQSRSYAEYLAMALYADIDKEDCNAVLKNLDLYIPEIKLPISYTQVVVSKLVETFKGNDLTVALDRFLDHVRLYKKKGGSLDNYFGSDWRIILRGINTLEGLELVLDHLNVLANKGGLKEDYVKLVLSKFLRKTEKQPKLRNALLEHLTEYGRKIGMPGRYVPSLVLKTLDAAKKKDYTELKPVFDSYLSHLSEYNKKIGNPNLYIGNVLSELLSNQTLKQKLVDGANREFVESFEASSNLLVKNIETYNSKFVQRIGPMDLSYFYALGRFASGDLSKLKSNLKSFERVLQHGARYLGNVSLLVSWLDQGALKSNDDIYRADHYLKAIRESDIDDLQLEKFFSKNLLEVIPPEGQSKNYVKEIESTITHLATGGEQKAFDRVMEIFNSKNVDTSKKTSLIKALTEVHFSGVKGPFISNVCRVETNTRSLIEAIKFLPALNDLVEESIISEEELATITSKPGIVKTGAALLREKVEGVFGLDAEIKPHSDFKEALSDFDFVRTLFHLYANYEAGYQEDLSEVVKAFHEGGVEGVEDLKFNPEKNELALEQVFEKKDLLNEFRKLSSKSISVGGLATTKLVDAAESHLSQTVNHYNDAKKLFDSFKTLIEEADLKKLVKENNTLSKKLEKDVAGRLKNLSEEKRESERKGVERKALTSMVKGLKKQGLSDLNSYSELVESAKVLQVKLGTSEEEQKKAMDEFLKKSKKFSKAVDGAINHLHYQDKKFSQNEFTKLSLALKDAKSLAQFKPVESKGVVKVFAEITRDPRVILRFGFQGPGGSNCHAPGGGYEQGLIGMLRDANQEVIHFYEKEANGNKRTVGVQHLVGGNVDSGSDKVDFVHVAEPAYTNFPKLKEQLVITGARLGLKLMKEVTPELKFAFANHPEAVKQEIFVPRSSSGGYLDAFGGTRGKSAFSKHIKLKRKVLA